MHWIEEVGVLSVPHPLEEPRCVPQRALAESGAARKAVMYGGGERDTEGCSCTECILFPHKSLTDQQLLSALQSVLCPSTHRL